MTWLFLSLVVGISAGIVILLVGVRQPFPVILDQMHYSRTRKGCFFNAQGCPVQDDITVMRLEDEFQLIMEKYRSERTAYFPK